MITQFSIIGIFVAGLVVMRLGEPHFARYGYEARSAEFAWIVLLFTVITIGALFTADDFARLWRPVFADPDVPGMRLDQVLFFVFTVDALCTSLLVHKTHGSRTSPFAAIFFAIPALAIFLRQPPSYVIFYSVLVAGLFSINLVYYRAADRRRMSSYPDTTSEDLSGSGVFWFVAIATFALTTTIGLITQPR